jgi:RNA polymerase sigma-70 factor (ECF subfamily)
MDISANKDLETWMAAVADNRCKKSYSALFKHFATKVKRAAYKQLGQLQSDAIAMEATQEVMTQVWRKAHLYHPDKGTVTTWIYTITRNVCFDMLRKVKNKTEINLGDDIWPLFDQDMSQDDVFRDHLHDQRLLECVKALPEKQHQIVHGVFFLELSQEQLARKLNIPLGTVKSRLRLAMQKLRQELGETE